MPGEPLPETRFVDLARGDQLLLCTDGLSGMLSHVEIRAVLGGASDPQSACARLIDAGNHAGGKDNVRVLLVTVS